MVVLDESDGSADEVQIMDPAPLKGLVCQKWCVCVCFLLTDDMSLVHMGSARRVKICHIY